MDYKEEQDGEMEALRSIYTEEEFEELSSDPWSFVISISVEMNDLTAQCSIQFDLPPQYPDTVPLFSILSQSQNISSTEPLLQVLQEQSQDNIGMPMIFTLTSALQEKLQQLLEEEKESETLALRQKEEEEQRKEEEKYKGTIVTVESFAEWRKAFVEEMGLNKVIRDTSRLTGREMFERDASLALSDAAFLLEGEESESVAVGDEVEVDESLFQDLGDLEDEDINS